MQRPITLFAIALLTGIVGFLGGWSTIVAQSGKRFGRVVAVSWGDAAHAKAHYGALVYLRQKDNAYSVRARVYLGRGNSEFHDCGELGQTQTDTEAVARWGTVEWKPDGLHIGSGTNHFFLARAQLERNR